MNTRTIFSLMLSVFTISQGITQPILEVGKPIPSMAFEPVYHWKQRSFSTKDLHGQPAVLYFFSSACTASFKHIRQLDQVFAENKERVTMLLVGLDLGDSIQATYEAYSRRYNLNLPITFDRSIYQQYSIRGVPKVIWIKRDGTIQAITNIITEDYVDKFLSGQHFDFIDYSSAGKELLKRFDPDEPFLMGGESEAKYSAIIQYSLLAKWENGMPNYIPYAELYRSPLDGLKYLQLIGRSLADMYRLAYFGRTSLWNNTDTIAYGNYHYAPVLEMKDPSIFKSDYDLGINLFCYSQMLPAEKRTPGNMIKVLQNDLGIFLGYHAQIETRQMPYLALTATDAGRKRLATSGGPAVFHTKLTGISSSNIPVQDLITSISYYNGLAFKDLPLLDETGIKGNIDISISAIMTDFEDVKRALDKCGLRIVEGKRPMRAIVIRDQK